MAYTRTWDNAAPPNARDANEIGEAIRELRVDIQQRLASFFEDIDVDPLVPNDTYSGAATDRVLILSPFDIPEADNIAQDLGAGYVSLTTGGSAGTARKPLVIPVGYTITELALAMSITNGDTTTFSLRCVDITTGAETNISGDQAIAGTGSLAVNTSGALAHVVTNVQQFYVTIALDADNVTNVYGFRLKITKSTNAQGY